MLIFFRRIFEKKNYMVPFICSAMMLFSSCSNSSCKKDHENLSSIDYDFNSKTYKSLNLKNYSFDKKLLKLVGEKGFYLHFLDQKDYLKVPKWFAITTHIFQKEMLIHQNTTNKIQEIVELSKKWNFADLQQRKEIESEVFRKGKLIQDEILNITFSKEFVNLVEKMYLILSENNTSSFVSVRSSAVFEDLPARCFSIYETFLNQQGVEAILNSIKECWASVFGKRALAYTLNKGILQEELVIGVIIQEMIQPKVSGTAFTLDSTSDYPGIQVIGNFGLKGVVDGSVVGDSFIMNAENLDIIKRVVGSKRFYYQPSLQTSKMECIPTPGFVNKICCLDCQEAKQIGNLIRKLSKDYQETFKRKTVDIEFAIGKKDDLIYLLQMRPIPIKNLEKKIDSSKPNLEIIARGKYSILSGTHGKLKLIRNFEDVEKNNIILEKEDIIVTNNVTDAWIKYLPQIKGLITIEGTPNARLFVEAKEKNIPCIVGVRNAFDIFSYFNGQQVTLDGMNKCIYKGNVDLTQVSPQDVNNQLKVVSIESLPNEDEILQDFRIRQMLLKDEKGYWYLSPESKLSGPLLDFQISAFYKRAELLQKAYGKGAKKVTVNTEFIIQNNKIYHKWIPYSEQMNLFEKMGLEQSEIYHEQFEKKLMEFENLCQNFKISTDYWDLLQDVSSEAFAYMWLSYWFQQYVKIKASEYANQKQIPFVFYENFCKQIQFNSYEIIKELEENGYLLFQEIIKNTKKDGIAFEAITYDLLKKRYPQLFNELFRFACRYKLRSDIDFIDAPPVDIAFQKIMSFKDEVNLPSCHKVANNFIDEQYFIEYPEIQRWISLSIQAAIQHRNASHVLVRGQWLIRDALLKFANDLVKNGKLLKAEDILLCKSEQIRKFIEEKEKN